MSATPHGSTLTKPTLIEAAKAFAASAKAKNTRKAYRADWRTFTAWCGKHDAAPLPAMPETVALYLTHRATTGAKASSIARALVAISQAHQLAGHVSPRSSPMVREVMKGIRRQLGSAKRQAKPLLPRDLRELLSILPASLIGIRDRALLVIGFAGALRRSELVGLNAEDLQFESDGLKVTLRRSKTDQEGHGRVVGVPPGAHPETCPVRAMRAWLDAATITSGPVFREVTRHGKLGTTRLNDRSVVKVIKRRCHEAELDPRGFSGHSLRAGLVTAAAKARKSVASIQRQTGHRSVAMVNEYVRAAGVFDDNAFSGLDL
ncbi:MAG: site-specific integrase [Myxococcaceae bacterium]|nr:site-specific integrase [Myxococcaceae bacterium]